MSEYSRRLAHSLCHVHSVALCCDFVMERIVAFCLPTLFFPFLSQREQQPNPDASAASASPSTHPSHSPRAVINASVVAQLRKHQQEHETGWKEKLRPPPAPP